MQTLAQIPTSLFRPCQTNFDAMSRRVVRIHVDGWDSPWKMSKICLLHPEGTTGLGWPVEVSHRMVLPLLPNGKPLAGGWLGQYSMPAPQSPLFGWSPLRHNVFPHEPSVLLPWTMRQRHDFACPAHV